MPDRNGSLCGCHVGTGSSFSFGSGKCKTGAKRKKQSRISAAYIDTNADAAGEKGGAGTDAARVPDAVGKKCRCCRVAEDRRYGD